MKTQQICQIYFSMFRKELILNPHDSTDTN